MCLSDQNKLQRARLLFVLLTVYDDVLFLVLHIETVNNAPASFSVTPLSDNSYCFHCQLFGASRGVLSGFCIGLALMNADRIILAPLQRPFSP